MGLYRRWHTNKLIDQALGYDAHTKAGHSMHGEIIEGIKTPLFRKTMVAVVGGSAVGISVCVLLLPPEQPSLKQYLPATNVAPSPHPTHELLSADDGPTAQTSERYEMTATSTTLIPEHTP